MFGCGDCTAMWAQFCSMSHGVMAWGRVPVGFGVKTGQGHVPTRGSASQAKHESDCALSHSTPHMGQCVLKIHGSCLVRDGW